MQTVAQKQALVITHKKAKKIRNNVALTEQVADWLEGQDTITDKNFSYGVCIVSGIMLIIRTAALLL